MAITYNSPTTIYGPNLVPVLTEIFFENATVKNNWVTFNDNMKAGTLITTASLTATAQLYTGNALSASGGITITDRAVLLTKLEYKDTFLEETIRATRFNESMKKGAYEIESNEFNTKVLGMYSPKVSADAENLFWGGITSATKTAIAALTPGAGQGSITAAAQTAVGTLTAGLVDGIFAKAFYDNGAIGGYTKVTGTTVTAVNIADEMAKIFAAISPERMQDPNDPVIVYCPRAWKQLVYNANNAKGAAQQINFQVEGADFATSRVYYNGLEMVFVPVPSNLWAYANNRSRVMWNCDSIDDVNKVEIGKVANDSDVKFLRAIYTIHTHIADAPKGILYGG
jgi:hypothetical protein